MYESCIKGLRWLAFMFPETHPAKDDTARISNNIHLYCSQAANAIEDLETRIDKALDALDRGNDNDWARAALEGRD